MDEATSKMYEQATSFAKMWWELASKMAGAGFSFSPDAAPPEALRQMRDATFKAMEESCVDYMQSPQFLEAMKQNMDAAVAVRKQLNDFWTALHHQTQGVAREDVDGLARTLRHIETHLGGRLDEMASRLGKIEEQLATLDGRRQPKTPPKASRSRAPGAAKKRPKR